MISAERPPHLPATGVAFVSEPCVLRTPEDLIGLPAVLTPKAEAEGFEAHGLISTVAGENDQVGPGDLVAVLLFHWPEQPPRLVEARVIGPTVERGKALHAAAATAPAIGDAVRACRMPCHPDEERPVVAVVGRPPFLRLRHYFEDVFLQGIHIKFLELLRVIEVRAHRV